MVSESYNLEKYNICFVDSKHVMFGMELQPHDHSKAFVWYRILLSVHECS